MQSFQWDFRPSTNSQIIWAHWVYSSRHVCQQRTHLCLFLLKRNIWHKADTLIELWKSKLLSHHQHRKERQMWTRALDVGQVNFCRTAERRPRQVSYTVTKKRKQQWEKYAMNCAVLYESGFTSAIPGIARHITNLYKNNKSYFIFCTIITVSF